LNSVNKLFKMCGHIALNGSSSAVSNTVANIADRSGVSRYDIPCLNYSYSQQRSDVSTVSTSIRAFCLLYHDAHGHDRSNLMDIISYLCTN
jgi:hypothetical protein